MSEAYGAVAGHDGSGAPLPGIGPHDFSTAQRVHEVGTTVSSESWARVVLAPTAEAAQYVVRACPDVWQATQSWLASRLFGALGLATPTAILVRGCSQAFDATCDPERVFLATAFLPGCQAFGEWLEGVAASRAIESALHRPPDERGRVGRDSGARVPTLAQAFPDQAARRAKICTLLPDIYQCELERQYFAALWLGNRGLCDAGLDNVGIWRDREDLPRVMTMNFDACLFSRGVGQYPAALPDSILEAVATSPCGEHDAPFVRRLSCLTSDACEKAVRDALKQPDGVRAVAAEMAYRLGRIDAPGVQPWVVAACDFVRHARGCTGTPVDTPDVDGLIERLLSRRDSVVKLLGGASAAAMWARWHSTRAAAISAQQLPFLTQA
ncbi:hypothetical protein [Pandoraea pnomenusa]|uniref:hypothetical protein n=1 Tax=Pandoraea pnomenusa TaxID=93220 RepID=UPI003341BDA5